MVRASVERYAGAASAALVCALEGLLKEEREKPRVRQDSFNVLGGDALRRESFSRGESRYSRHSRHSRQSIPHSRHRDSRTSLSYHHANSVTRRRESTASRSTCGTFGMIESPRSVHGRKFSQAYSWKHEEL